MEHTKELISIGLSALAPSPFNVRRHSVGQIEELAALIDSQGLLHNLVVTEQVVGRGKARKVKFAVAAGERRRRALLLLQQRGRLPKGHEVLCELVQRRLTLSALSPKLLALYREDGINLDQLMALTLSDDHAAVSYTHLTLPTNREV